MPLFEETITYIQFYNTTDLPVLIDAWNTPAYSSVSTLTTTRIEPFESKIVHSSVGEWHMNAMFYNESDNFAWKGRGLGKYDPSIGKFRSSPCAMGNYSWMEYKHFMCEYSDFKTESDDRVKGQIKFSISKDLCFINS
jgi:hypothetical protein